MPNIDKISKELQDSGKLYEGFLLSEKERKEVVEYYKLYKHSQNETKPKLSKKEKISSFSVIQAKNGELFSVYNPKVHNTFTNEPIRKGKRAVIKAAQNLKTGRWAALKLHKYEIDTFDELEIRDMEEAQTEIKYLALLGILQGQQTITKVKGDKKLEENYIFKDIIPGVELENLRKHRTEISEHDCLIIYLNTLKALQELKINSILHRDLHGGNILVDIEHHLDVRFIDWETAFDLDQNGFYVQVHLNGTEKIGNGLDVLYAIEALKKFVGSAYFDNIFNREFFHNCWKDGQYMTVDLQPYIQITEQLIKKLSEKTKPSFSIELSYKTLSSSDPSSTFYDKDTGSSWSLSAFKNISIKDNSNNPTPSGMRHKSEPNIVRSKNGNFRRTF